jgi:hypothetical protein
LKIDDNVKLNHNTQHDASAQGKDVRSDWTS